jgi:hypothetical protein
VFSDVRDTDTGRHRSIIDRLEAKAIDETDEEDADSTDAHSR